MMNKQRIRLAGVALAALLSTVSAIPAQAQEGTAGEIRLRKLEAEVRALQRQVFPGGDTKLFGQQAANPAPAPAPATETPITPPANTALTDILARLSAVEAQNARLTAQIEELSNHVRQLDAAKAAAAAANAPVEQGVAPEPAPAPTPAPVRASSAATPVAAPKPVAAPPSRVAAVKAIAKPSTGDAGEDEYTYGYKLWEARFFPEAQQQLKLYLDQYPKHKRVSYARNLLGRAYLDDGKPREAAPWFLQNYQADKKGARASDSLLYLSDAMIELKDINRACIALGEFADSYPADAAGRLKPAYDSIRAKVKCN